MNTDSHNSHLTLNDKLQAIIDDEPYTIRAYVAQTALDYSDDGPETMFHDLQACGCAGGTINSLIYFYNTHDFFDKYYREITWLVEEHETNFGYPLKIEGDLKNFLAWYAFEHEAFNLVCELELDL